MKMIRLTLFVSQDENLNDVLDMSVNLMSEHPKAMVPAFDRRNGLRYTVESSERTVNIFPLS